MNIRAALRTDRMCKALTGLSVHEFETLLIDFSWNYTEYEAKKKPKRQRKIGGGAHGILETVEEKFFYSLFYLKTYPTFDVLGSQFGMARSKAHVNTYKLSPILYHTLVSLGLMPYREFETPEDLKTILSGIDQVIIDATERAYRRSQDEEEQKAHYSGKKNNTPSKTP